LAIEFKLGAEDAHKMGELGTAQIRAWLDATYCFRIDSSVDDVDRDGKPYTKVRVPQLKPGRFGRFDFVGSGLGVNGDSANELYVECKQYSSAGRQEKLYDEYVAVGFSAFVALERGISASPRIEFMWATTHPFALNS
jgi:hypothetical protein